MVGAKFVVRGGRRWRQLDVASGRVEGWGAARFVYVRNGRLQPAPRAAVLRGLRALAAGRPGAVRDGPRLQHSPRSDTSVETSQEAKCGHHCCKCCQQPNIKCRADATFNHVLKATTSSVGVQTASGPTSKRKRSSSDETSDEVFAKRSKFRRKNECPTFEPKSEQSVDKSQRSDELLKESLADRKQTQNSESNDCKELLIAEEDVVLLRSFVENDAKNVFDVDLERFDEDDTYKGLIFYKLNPLVNVERCRRIGEMLQAGVRRERSEATPGLRAAPRRPRSPGTRARPIPDDMETKSVTAASSKKSIDTNDKQVNKENFSKSELVNRRPNGRFLRRRGHRVLEENVTTTTNTSNKDRSGSVGTGAAGETGAKTSARDEEPCAAPAAQAQAKRAYREYSAEEDECIVRWVAGAGRARRVNGNQVWQELQLVHERRTGTARSWQSLRNRYLRYLLPSLGATSLSAEDAARLRAGAASGCIKGGRLPQRRNSMFAAGGERGAWSRRARPALASTRGLTAGRGLAGNEREKEKEKDSEESEETTPPRGHTPPKGRTSPIPMVRVPTPTYSELTRRFARRYRSTPNSDFSEPDGSDPRRRSRSRRPEPEPRRGTRRSSRLADNGRRSPDVTDSGRHRTMSSDTERGGSTTTRRPSRRPRPDGDGLWSSDDDRQTDRRRSSDDSSSESDSARGRGRVTRQQADSTIRHPADGSRASTRRTVPARPTRKDASTDAGRREADRDRRPRTRRLFNPNAL